MKKHTDLDGVKQVASALLFTDIEKTKYSPMVVQHPFTNTGVTAISVEGSFRLLNLLENPEDLIYGDRVCGSKLTMLKRHIKSIA